VISLSTIGINVQSSGNTIYANIIMQNQCGIKMQNSNNNKVFHNNFMDNNMQISISTSSGNVWDDGYPSGGNYWACHISLDSFGGVWQNIAGSDGIVDVPYTIATNNIDNYPLLKPFSTHNIGITFVFGSRTSIAESCPMRLNVTIQNLGMYDETFAVIFYVNDSVILTQQICLCARNSSVLVLTWNTGGLTKGRYALKVEVNVVPDETDTGDNTYSFLAALTIPGDVNGDFTVNILDAIALSNAFNTSPNSKSWNANADINNDNAVNILDAIVLSNHFLQHYP
jgi:parallel beta-helix repeat protein